MLNRDFKEFAELLDAHGVEYPLAGGYALAAYDFKANKRAAGRNKDLADLDALEGCAGASNPD